MSKEFSELNGYGVKDATARAAIEALKESGGGGKLYKHILHIDGDDFSSNAIYTMTVYISFISSNPTPITKSDFVYDESVGSSILDKYPSMKGALCHIYNLVDIDDTFMIFDLYNLCLDAQGHVVVEIMSHDQAVLRDYLVSTIIVEDTVIEI